MKKNKKTGPCGTNGKKNIQAFGRKSGGKKTMEDLRIDSKGKATPITGLCGLEGSGRLRLQIS